MTLRSVVENRQHTAFRTAAVTMGLLTVAGAVAPAALADDGTSAPAPDTTGSTGATQTQTSTPQVLTTAPAPATAAVVPGAAYFGTGKLALTLSASDAGAPAGATVLPAGGSVQLHFSQVNGAPVDITGACTLDQFGYCESPTNGLPSVASGVTYASVPQNATFTMTLVGAPTAGGVMATGAATAIGYSDTVAGTTTALGGSFPAALGTITAPGAYRTVAVALSGTGSLAGATFTLGVETAVTNDQGIATFSRLYNKGSYSIVQTAGPGGTTFDATPRSLSVAAATSLTERATPVTLSVTGAVGPVVATPTPTATPVATTPSAPTSTATSSVASSTIAAGKKQTVTIGGFQPFETVHGVLHSTPVDLGTVQADANGVATFTFTLPAGLEAGSHDVTLTGVTSGVAGSVGFTVSAAAATGGLAYTGTDAVPLLALGGGLLAAGAGALTVANRRRRAA